MNPHEICPHKDDVMCSCDAIKEEHGEEMTLHFIKNIENFQFSLSYGTLEEPAPYLLCMAGICKVCGGRLCAGVDLPKYLCGNGLLAMVYHYMECLNLDVLDQFAALFHEEDQAVVLQWLEENDLAEKGDCHE